MSGEVNRMDDRLPGEIVRPVNRFGFLRLFLATILILILFNLICLWYLRHFPANPGYWLVRHKWRMLMEIQKPVDWLILGDSSALHGVIPSLFNAEINGTSINLSTIGDMTILGDLWMLEAYIRKFGPPPNVLVVRVYDSWHRDPEPSVIAQAPTAWGTQILSDLNIPCNSRCKANYLLARYLPVYSESTSLSRVIKSPSKLFQSPVRVDGGGYLPVFNAAPDQVLIDAQRHIRDYTNRKFQISQTAAFCLKKISALADRHGFTVYFAASPLYEGLVRDEKIDRYQQQVWSKIDSVTSGSSKIHVIAHSIPFLKEELTSVDHLIHPAAEKFTRTLARTILSSPVVTDRKTSGPVR